jgi:hypothetical protein
MNGVSYADLAGKLKAGTVIVQCSFCEEKCLLEWRREI